VPYRGGSKHFHKGGGGEFFLKKKIGFQNDLLKEKSKDTELSFKVKITKHGKKKNDKDEIGKLEILC
jgi:hypothetical protein